MNFVLSSLTRERLQEAIDVVFETGLDTKEEIEHHLEHIDAHYVAIDGDKIIGVIGWYQDTVNYATNAMGDKFPGPEAYWVGFFAVQENYRGKGIGYALLQKLESALKEKGVNVLWVSSVPEAGKYYERQNYQLVMEGRINGNQKYFLSKNLSQNS
jgi:GNAT superfamily N-acetyltransferase